MRACVCACSILTLEQLFIHLVKSGDHLQFFILTIMAIFKIKIKFEIKYYMHGLYYPHIMSIKNDEILCIFHRASSDLELHSSN